MLSCLSPIFSVVAQVLPEPLAVLDSRALAGKAFNQQCCRQARVRVPAEHFPAWEKPAEENILTAVLPSY